MPLNEIAFEQMYLALESTRGTAVTTPTHALELAGVFKHYRDWYEAADPIGMLEEITREVLIDTGCDIEASGDVDLHNMPVLLNTLVKANSSFGTPSGASLSKLIDFPPTLTSDDLKSFTGFYGNPNTMMFRSPYCMWDEAKISAEIGKKALGIKLKGKGRYPTKLSSLPTFPSPLLGPLLVPALMQVFVDTTTIGATQIAPGRIVKVEHTIPTGVTYKKHDQGPTATLDYDDTGRNPRHIETLIVFEAKDSNQFDQYEAGTDLKTRVRYNGPLIETTAGPVNWYNYLDVDTYGKWKKLDWGDYESSNRTIGLLIRSKYNATAGFSWRMGVQSIKNSL